MCNNSEHSSALKTNKIAAKCFGTNSVEKLCTNAKIDAVCYWGLSSLCWKVLTQFEPDSQSAEEIS